ncbi:MAG: AAA family ATPase, partial [Lachnospiraceae bacterium]|nr:AAA family ATPase [Lachnospiraceae bacterium]
KEDLIDMQRQADHVFVHDAIYDYVARLAEATRRNELITLGISPRGSLALVSMAKATAMMAGRDFVIPEDVGFCFATTVIHRMILNARARVGNLTLEEIAADILEQTPKPRLING